MPKDEVEVDELELDVVEVRGAPITTVPDAEPLAEIVVNVVV